MLCRLGQRTFAFVMTCWRAGRPTSRGELGADLQAEFEAGTREQIGMVEVVVSEYGKVERARLISNPSNVLDSMLLSAVKAWQFTPATRYEQAVRYRQVMPILVVR